MTSWKKNIEGCLFPLPSSLPSLPVLIFFFIKKTTYLGYFTSHPNPSFLLPRGASTRHRRLVLPLCPHQHWMWTAAWALSGLHLSRPFLTMVPLFSPLPWVSPSWQGPGVTRPVRDRSDWLMIRLFNNLHMLHVFFREMSWSRVQMAWLTKRFNACRWNLCDL